MKRIIINESVRAVADKYATNIFKGRKANFQQPTDLLKKFEKELSKSKIEEKKILCLYVNEIRNKHKELLNAEPKKMIKLIDEFNSILKISPPKTDKEKEKQIKHLMEIKVTFKKITKLFYEWIIDLLRYDDICRQIIQYLHELNIRTCIYCNTQYAATVRKEGTQNTTYEAFYELDHFYPKSLYPFLCTNFYNLQPCCSSCNKHKSTKRSLFNLYTNDNKDEETNPFLFSVSKENIIKQYFVYKDMDSIEIHFDAPHNDELRTNHEDCFHITTLYSAFKDVAEDIIWKRRVWNNTYMEMMEKQYDGMSIPAEVQNRIIFGFYTEERDIHLRPLTKLQQDLFKQLDLI